MTAVLVALALSAAGPPAHNASDVEDDYPRALAIARERNVPLLVDVWAPW